MEAASVQRPHISSTKRSIALSIVLGALTLALFWPAVHYELVNLDDLAYITDNRLIHDGLTWSSLREAFTSVYHVMWAPGLWISYMLDMEMFGPQPWGTHFTNVLLHAINTLLAYLLFWRWTRRPWCAFWAAAIWAWHPLRVESVAWVSARKDVLSGLFFICCLLFYDLAKRPLSTGQPLPPMRQRLWSAASWLSLAAGLTVKPMLVTAPAVLLLMDIWPLRRTTLQFSDCIRKLPRLIAEKWPFWLLAAASSFMAIYAHSQGTSLKSASLAERTLTLPLHYVFYLLKTIYPARLTVLYPDMAFHVVDVFVATLCLLVITLLAWTLRRRSLPPLIGWLWFLGVMLPISGIIRFGAQSLADRFTYLPTLGLSVMFLHLPHLRYPFLRNLCRFAGMALLLVVAVLTRQQLPAWKNTDQLYDRLLLHSPNHPFGLAHRATLLHQRGQLQEAEALWIRICNSPANNDIFQFELAKTMAAQGHTQRAYEHLDSMTLRSPGSSTGLYHFLLSMFLTQLENYPDALRYVHVAQKQVSPNNILQDDLNLLGMVISYHMGDTASALKWARNLSAYRDKTHIEFHDLLPYYVGQWQRFQRLDALAYFRDYISLYPGHADALNNLAWLMATSEWSPIPPEDIVALAFHTTTLAPNNPVLLDTLGVALAHAGRFEEAKQIAGQALAVVQKAGQQDSPLHQSIIRHIHAYQKEQPWREKQAADRMMSLFYAP